MVTVLRINHKILAAI